MVSELTLLAEVIARINNDILPAAHYLEFTGGKLDGKFRRVHGPSIIDDYYSSYERGIEQTVIEKYTLSGNIRLGDDLPDGQKCLFYPFAYVSEVVSDCPLVPTYSVKRSPWEY